MEVFRLFGSILIDSKDAENSISKTESKAEKLVTSMGKGLKTAAKWGTTIAAGAAAAAAAAVGALNNVEESTREFRENQAKLQTAFEAAGAGADAAKDAYSGLYRVLGDDGAATEASQLLAQIATNSQSVGMWTDIAAGAVGAFGDSLPIGSMMEFSVETIKSGQITGDLTRVLQYAGIAEEEFQAQLDACTTEAERNRLVTYTLSRAFADATDAFKANNAEAIANRDIQLQQQDAMAKLGETVAKVKNRLSQEFTPELNNVAAAFSDVISGTEGADVALQQAIEGLVKKAMENLPEFLTFGVDLITSISTGIIKSIPSLVESIPEIVKALWDALRNMGSEFVEMGREMLRGIGKGFNASNFSADYSFGGAAAQNGYGGAGIQTGFGYSHAAGLAYVPYDNYPINAHRGEILLNAADAGTLLDGMRAIMSSTVNAMGALGSGAVRVEIPISINGREFYRASIDDLRAVMRSDPEVT